MNEDIMAKLEAIHSDLKSAVAILNVLQGAAVGSWQWDKRAGTLKMFDSMGTQIAVFTVSDTPEMAQRERRVDLES